MLHNIERPDCEAWAHKEKESKPMASDAAILIDSTKLFEKLASPASRDPLLSLFGIPVVVLDNMPADKIAFVTYKKPTGLFPYKEIADIKVIDVFVEGEDAPQDL